MKGVRACNSDDISSVKLIDSISTARGGWHAIHPTVTIRCTITAAATRKEGVTKFAARTAIETWGTFLASCTYEISAAFTLKFARRTCATPVGAVFTWPREHVATI